MNYLAPPEDSKRPRHRRRSLATPGALQVIPDTDEPVKFTEEQALQACAQRLSKRRGSCPPTPGFKVRL